jgi:hypothetical protein
MRSRKFHQGALSVIKGVLEQHTGIRGHITVAASLRLILGYLSDFAFFSPTNNFQSRWAKHFAITVPMSERPYSPLSGGSGSQNRPSACAFAGTSSEILFSRRTLWASPREARLHQQHSNPNHDTKLLEKFKSRNGKRSLILFTPSRRPRKSVRKSTRSRPFLAKLMCWR